MSTCEQNKDGHTVGLLVSHLLNVDGPLLAVDLHDLALTALEVATDDHDLIILAHGERTHLANISKPYTQSKIGRQKICRKHATKQLLSC